MQRSSSPLTPILIVSSLCLVLSLMGCKQDEPVPVAAKVEKIELIQQDLVNIEYGEAVQKTAFTGTIRAVNQSSIQAQVTATATRVNAQVGQAVQKGQVLVVLNNQDNAARLAQARANLAASQAQANQAQLMVQRKKRLLAQGFISQVDYEQSVVDYQSQQESVYAQQANVDIAAKAAQDGILRSPISGVITVRQVEPGQTVSAGQTLFEVLDPTQLELQGKVSSEQQAALQVGAKVEYQIQGQADQMSATLSRVAPLADVNNRQIEFFAVPQQQIQSLSIGAFVEGHIVSGAPIAGQMIPLDTIQDPETAPYVWVVRAGKLAKAPITVLERNDAAKRAIVSGLATGDQISRIRFNDKQLNQPVSISP